jgi:hypothetical protein
VRVNKPTKWLIMGQQKDRIVGEDDDDDDVDDDDDDDHSGDVDYDEE